MVPKTLPRGGSPVKVWESKRLAGTYSDRRAFTGSTWTARWTAGSAATSAVARRANEGRTSILISAPFTW